MSKHQFRFVSDWRIDAPSAAVFERLSDPGTFSSWWPGFRSRSLCSPPGVVGRAARLEVRSLLALSLRFEARIVSAIPGREIAVLAEGDLRGTAVVQIRPSGPRTLVTFDWQVTLERPRLARLARPLRPLLALSHELAMRRGERGLNRSFRGRRSAHTWAGVG
jgi:carbon monoxide dehydrogenase subunit G